MTLNLEKILSSPNYKLFKKIGEITAAEGIPVYLMAGEPLKACLGGKTAGDVTLCVIGPERELIKVLKEKFKKHFEQISKDVIKYTFAPGKDKPPPVIMTLMGTKKIPFDPKNLERTNKLIDKTLTGILSGCGLIIDGTAFSLNPDDFGRLIDPWNLKEDLKKKNLRFINAESAVQEPHIVFRALRYAAQYDLKLDESSDNLIASMMKIKGMTKVQKMHLRDEFILILKSPKAASILEKAFKQHLMHFISTGLRYNAGMVKGIAQVDKVCQWYDEHNPHKRDIDKWVMRSCVFFESLGFKKTVDVCDKLLFQRGDRLRILKFNSKAREIEEQLSIPGVVKASYVFKCLDGLPYEIMLLVLAMSKNAACRRRIKDYFLKYSNIELQTKKSDFSKITIKEEKLIDDAFYRAKLLKLDGKLKNKDSERKYVLKALEELKV